MRRSTYVFLLFRHCHLDAAVIEAADEADFMKSLLSFESLELSARVSMACKRVNWSLVRFFFVMVLISIKINVHHTDSNFCQKKQNLDKKKRIRDL